MICFGFLAFRESKPLMATPRRLLIVFLKFPEPGRVKTRLAAGVGAGAAAAIYRRLAALTFEAVRSWAGRRGRAVWVAFDPADREQDVRAWVDLLLPAPRPAVTLRPQGGGDLGARLERQFSAAYSAHYQFVVAIGTDCPDLAPAVLDDALARLDRADVVLGPAADGGYYLLGLKRPAPDLFRHIPWSSAHTLQATLLAAATAGLTVDLLPQLADVDTESDWRAWVARDPRARTDETI
jgi:rSAM/selenodomain-associated transferase 1